MSRPREVNEGRQPIAPREHHRSVVFLHEGFHCQVLERRSEAIEQETPLDIYRGRQFQPHDVEYLAKSHPGYCQAKPAPITPQWQQTCILRVLK